MFFIFIYLFKENVKKSYQAPAKKICKSEIGGSKVPKVLNIVESLKQSSKNRDDEIFTHEEKIFMFL